MMGMTGLGTPACDESWLFANERCVIIIFSLLQLGCFGQAENDIASGPEPPDNRHVEEAEIHRLLDLVTEETEPSLGHITDAQSQLVDRGVKVLPFIVPWMTDEGVGRQAYAKIVIERISMHEFGWESGKRDEEWRSSEWDEFWDKLGGCNPGLGDDHCKKTQNLWTSYLQKLSEAGEPFGTNFP